MSGQEPENKEQPTRERIRNIWLIFIRNIWLISVIILSIIGLITVVSRDPLSDKPPSEKVWAINQDVPAYHLITTSDIKEKPVEEVTSEHLRVAGDSLTDAEPLYHYTNVAISKDTPLQSHQLVSTGFTTLTERTIIALPATSAMTFGGNLQPEDRISLWADEKKIATDLIVLDVQKQSPLVIQSSVPISLEVAEPYLIILAVESEDDVGTILAQSNLIITKP